MLLIDALASGSVILLVTTPEAGKPKCRLDFISVQSGEINKVRRALVDRLTSKKTDFNISSLEMPSKKNYKTIIMDASLTRPYDYDRVSKSEVSDILLSTAGVLEFTSAFTIVGDTTKEQNVALFASVVKNTYITTSDAVSLTFHPSTVTGSGDFKFKMMNLEKVGIYELLGDRKDHFGLVKLNKSEEFYMRESDMDQTTTATTQQEPVPASQQSEPATPVSKSRSNKNFKNLVSENKTASAGLGIAALVALGSIASKVGADEKKQENISARGNIFSSDRSREEVAGENLTRSEALELYKSL